MCKYIHRGRVLKKGEAWMGERITTSPFKKLAILCSTIGKEIITLGL